VVVSTTSGMPAEGVLLPDDLIVAVNDEPVLNIDELRSAVKASGWSQPLTVTLIRDGQTLTETLTPANNEGTAVIGVLGQTAYNYPFDVSITLNDVGGPSAGLMFALGIIDKVTPEDMTQGKKFAGTGTIDAAGNVGPIGGVRLKMYSAQAAGATFFLSPADNCDEVVGNVPSGIQVFSVATITEAVTAVTTAASGDAAAMAKLPTCT